MSQAYRCDICGDLFDPVQMDISDEFCTISEFWFQDKNQYVAHEVCYHEVEPTHLCPLCSRFFSKLMSGEINPKYLRWTKDPNEQETEAYKYGFSEGYEEGRKDRDREFSEMAREAIADILGRATEKAIQSDISAGCCCDRADSDLGEGKPSRCCGVSESHGKTTERPKRAQKVSE